MEAAQGHSHQELPYQGAAGRTRIERMHVRDPHGALRVVEVYTAVDVAREPVLKVLALSGDLHRLDDGSELAVPFVYHDPPARRFVLVVPHALRHQELKARAELMLALAADTLHPVPRYVRDCPTVIGIDGLRGILAHDGQPLALGQAPRLDFARTSPVRDEELREVREAAELTEDEALRESAEDVTGLVTEEVDPGEGAEDVTGFPGFTEVIDIGDAVEELGDDEVSSPGVADAPGRRSTIPPMRTRSQPPPLHRRSPAASARNGTPSSDALGPDEDTRVVAMPTEAEEASLPPPLPGEESSAEAGEAVDGEALAPVFPEDAPTATLLQALADPQQAIAAARALSQRGETTAAGALVKALETLDESQAAEVTVVLTQLGEAAGDALIEGLSSQASQVTQLCALALGRLQLRRALTPLVRRVGKAPRPLAQELSRALAGFGAGGVKAVARAVGQTSAQDGEAREAYVIALAHLAAAGYEDQVAGLKNDTTPAVADVATRALTLHDALAEEHQQLRDGPWHDDALPRLTQRYWRAAEPVPDKPAAGDAATSHP